jgi:hypothetical protein
VLYLESRRPLPPPCHLAPSLGVKATRTPIA